MTFSFGFQPTSSCGNCPTLLELHGTLRLGTTSHFSVQNKLTAHSLYIIYHLFLTMSILICIFFSSFLLKNATFSLALLRIKNPFSRTPTRKGVLICHLHLCTTQRVQPARSIIRSRDYCTLLTALVRREIFLDAVFL